ncbi:hypothetical protein [Actinoplanes sp. NPDC049316]|uniref:hypothetical protein n=1 Tax=Actinoplanes sp. NPDC049316 TaxID=3154727 RepID=UPI00342DF95B
MSGDPTPGDPDLIDDLARDYEEIRDDAQTALRVLGRGGSLSSARGDSMTKLRDMLDSLPGKLQRTVTSFDTAAQAYRTYARVLRDQQTRIDTAMDQAADVGSIARTAVPRPSPTAGPEEVASARKLADDVADAQAGLAAARRLAEDARRLRAAASDRCNRDLDEAAAQAIKPPPRRNFFQRIGDFFRNNPIARLLVDIFIAVVGVILPVVGIVLAAVSLVVTAIVQAAHGTFELGTLLVGLVSLVPAGVLFGSTVKLAGRVTSKITVTVQGSGKLFGEVAGSSRLITGFAKVQNTAAGFARTTTKEFARGVAEEVVTVGLNKAGNKNADGFNAASIFAGAAAGAVVDGGIDGFRKTVSGSDVSVDVESRAPAEHEAVVGESRSRAGGPTADTASDAPAATSPIAGADDGPGIEKVEVDVQPETPSAADDLRNRAADAAQEALAGGSAQAASAAVEGEQDPAGEFAGAALEAGAVLGAGEAAARRSTGFPQKFRR